MLLDLFILAKTPFALAKTENAFLTRNCCRIFRRDRLRVIIRASG